MGLGLVVAAAVHFLHQLPAVRVQHQRLAVLPGEGHRGIGLLQGERTRRAERELHRLPHPRALLVAHPPPAAVAAAAPTTEPTAAPPAPPAAPAPAGPPLALAARPPFATRAVGASHLVARVVALRLIQLPAPGEIRVLSRRAGRHDADDERRETREYSRSGHRETPVA